MLKDSIRFVSQRWQCWKSEFHRTEGSQIVELAVALPLLLVVVIGITDFGGAFNTKFRLTDAVREGARFASSATTADLSITPPSSVTATRDVVDNYLLGVHINDCGLSAATPTQAGLIWTYTANTGCAGTLTLIIDRGNVFTTTGGTPLTVEATHVKIQYPYTWRFSNVIRTLVPGATYAGLTLISAEGVMQNLN